MSDRAEGAPAGSPRARGDSLARRLRRAAGTLLAVAAILLATAFFAVRTAGGRTLVEDHVRKLIGEDVTIGSTSIGWPFDLVVRNVTTRDFVEDAPGVRCAEARIGLRPGAPLRAVLYGAEMNLAQAPSGAWLPGRFSGLGEMPQRNLAEISRITAGLRRRCALEVRDGRVRWFDAEGSLLAEAEGVQFEMLAAPLPRRRTTYFRLAVREGKIAHGAAFMGAEREWLAADGADYIELSRPAEAPADPLPAFWEVQP